MRITKNKKKHNEFKVETVFTAGKILAIRNALEVSGTPVALEVLDELNSAIRDCPELKSDFGIE